MQQTSQCTECGSSLPVYSPKGLCPRCALNGMLEDPKAEGPGSSTETTLHRAHFGDYELLEEVARGGMGVIYRARQTSLKRVVALKMILAGQFASKQEVLRFRSEAEAAATLQHPNIVSIHETGERDGHHFFSMDFVQGRTLAEIVRDSPLPPHRAALYARIIAEAIHYAHGQGVLHRDLKPSNVIIDASDQPHITDFGLAKSLRNDFGVTVTGQVLGSPNFMPPEQTSAKSGKVGPWSDVYGIGAILYHLLTGRPPFQAETIEEVLLLLRDADPVSPRLLNPSVPRDLETICLKCLEKDPNRRYQNALALAGELKRFLADEPIEARPLSAIGRFGRWCKRRPAIATLSLSVLVLLLLVALGSSLAAWRVNRARSAEQRANRELRQTVRLLELDRAEDFFTTHDAASGVAHLSAMLRRDPFNSMAANRLVSALTQRGWALPAGAPLLHLGRVTTASFSPDGRQILTASWDEAGRVWDSKTGRRNFFLEHQAMLLSARYSADGSRIITASADGIARIWDSATGALQATLHHSNRIHWAELSADGRLAVTAGADKRARIWDADSGQLKQELRGHSRPVLIARFAPNAKLIATATDFGGLRLWSVESGKVVFRLEGHEDPTSIETLAFSPEGTRLISGGYDRTVRLWNVATGEMMGEPLMHQRPVWHTAFSPDGGLFLSACEDGTARLWNAQTLRTIGEPLRHESGVTFGRFSPDGQSLVTTSSDNTARVWDVQTQTPLCQPLRHIARVLHADFSPDGRRLVTASYDGTAQIWEVRKSAEPAVLIRHDRNVAPIALSLDGAAVLTAGQDKTLRLWDVRTGQPLSESLLQEEYVACGSFAPDGHRLAIAFTDHVAHIWDLGQWTPAGGTIARPGVTANPFKHNGRIHFMRFSPDGARIVTASADGTARVWDAPTGHPITPPLVHRSEVVAAQFSRDGRKIVTASEDRTARIWDAQSGQALAEPLVHLDHVKWAEFSPDDTRVTTSSTDGTACLWDAGTGRKLLTLQHARIVDKAVFSPDGRRIVTGCLDRTAQVWDADTGQALTPPLRHDFSVGFVGFSPNGRRIFTSAWSGPARLWDAETGRPLTEWLNAEGHYASVYFGLSSGHVIKGTKQGVLHIWNVPEAPVPIPEWFLQFGETLSGVRLGDRGSRELISKVNVEGMTGLVPQGADDFYARLARWFLCDPAERPLLRSESFSVQ